MLRRRITLGRAALIAVIALFLIQPAPSAAAESGLGDVLWQRVERVLQSLGFALPASRAAPDTAQETATRHQPRPALGGSRVVRDALADD